MVKHGRNKKRRAGRIGRTKLKNKGNYKRWDPDIKISHPIIRDNWDISKSPTVNLAKMGLRANVNAVVPTTEGQDEQERQNNNNSTSRNSVIQLFDIPDSDELSSKKKSRKNRLPLNEEEQKYVVKCLMKYGKSCLESIQNNDHGSDDNNGAGAGVGVGGTNGVDNINYKKMFRDIKINDMQYTEEKLRKMCARYLLLDPEQRLA